MTGLRLDDASIAFGQAAHTGKTVALLKALIGLTSTTNTIDLTQEFELHMPANVVIHGNTVLTQYHFILDRTLMPRKHLA